MLIIEAFQLITPVVLLHYSLTHRHNFIISIRRLFGKLLFIYVYYTVVLSIILLNCRPIDIDSLRLATYMAAYRVVFACLDQMRVKEHDLSSKCCTVS